MQIACPLDGRNDCIQSVPALVAGETRTGSFSGPSGSVTYSDGRYGYSAGTTTLYGTLVSDTARTLSCPEPPKRLGTLYFYGWVWLFFLSVCFIIGPFILWPVFKRQTDQDLSLRGSGFVSGFAWLSILLAPLMIHPVFGPLIIWAVLNQKRKSGSYERRNQLWQIARQRWQGLFYCHRCGIVFDPAANQYFQPNQMHAYLRTHEF